MQDLAQCFPAETQAVDHTFREEKKEEHGEETGSMSPCQPTQNELKLLSQFAGHREE